MKDMFKIEAVYSQAHRRFIVHDPDRPDLVLASGKDKRQTEELAKKKLVDQGRDYEGM